MAIRIGDYIRTRRPGAGRATAPADTIPMRLIDAARELQDAYDLHLAAVYRHGPQQTEQRWPLAGRPAQRPRIERHAGASFGEAIRVSRRSG